MPLTPEDKAREIIDSLIEKAGWHVCDINDANIHAHCGVVIRNFPLKSGHGFADYIFYVVQGVPFILEQYFSVAAEIEAAVETNLKRAERLRQVILKRAFAGKLTVTKERVLKINNVE